MTSSQPEPFSVSIPDEDVQNMYDLMSSGFLPESPVVPNAGWDYGVDLEWLKDMRAKFLRDFDWKKVEQDMNKVHQYTVEIEGNSVHFIHEPSTDEHAVPLLLLHGWPVTFWDFRKVLEPLTRPSTPSAASFHVVVPSIPGFGFSPLPPTRGWTIEDTARVFHKRMTEVLGYDRYFAHGGDWGSHILRIMGARYSPSLRLAHFNMFQCPPSGLLAYLDCLDYLPVFPSLTTWAKDLVYNVVLSDNEKKGLERGKQFLETGHGYAALQSTKPATIGYACHEPLSLLAYIGEKMYAWSDPTLLEPEDVFTTVALYYLTRTFPSSVVIYKESAKQVNELCLQGHPKWKVRCKMGFSFFPYEIGASPRPFIAAQGRLVWYQEHAKGGHFPALDNPTELVADIRDMTSKLWWTDQA